MDLSARLVVWLSPLLEKLFSTPRKEILSETCDPDDRMMGNMWRSVSWAVLMTLVMLSGFAVTVIGVETRQRAVQEASYEIGGFGAHFGVTAALYALRSWIGYRSEALERKLDFLVKPRSMDVLIVFVLYAAVRISLS